jgi:hypothetical protein
MKGRRKERANKKGITTTTTNPTETKKRTENKNSP